MKPSVIVIGSGLGGSVFASKVLKTYRVLLVELPDNVEPFQKRIVDISKPAVTNPHIGSGLGGTTKYWHNGLMEISEEVFEKKWPYKKNILDPYYQQAFELLSEIDYKKVQAKANELRVKLVNIGMPNNLLKKVLFYPLKRINIWKRLSLESRVELINGEVVDLVYEDNKIAGVLIKQDQNIISLKADYFVLAAGGIGTPILLQKLYSSFPQLQLEHAGFYYEDHPSAFIGQVELYRPIYKYWNYLLKTNNLRGNIRIPLSFNLDDLEISIQLRPEAQIKIGAMKTKVVGVLSDLRNYPFNLKNYIKLITHIDEIYELLSFKFGIRLPTKKYSLLLVSEQAPSFHRAIFSNDGKIYRDWRIPKEYVNKINEETLNIFGSMPTVFKKIHIFDSWEKNIFSSSHHSGTARIAKKNSKGVCDENARVQGVENLFVCDGSIIPASGVANTGLTIAALALKLGDYFNRKILN
jgi:hypothetical protein